MAIHIQTKNLKFFYWNFYLPLQCEILIKNIMETKTKKQEKNSKNQEIKKLSKVGEWLKSGQSALTIVDMRYVLK